MALVVDWNWRGAKALRPLLRQAISRWSHALSGGPGLQLSVATGLIDGPSAVLAEARVLDVDAITGLPMAAAITIDKVDLKPLLSTRSGRREVGTVLSHELGHALGFGTLWPGSGLTDATSYLGAGGVREYLALGGSGGSVLLELEGGAGTAGVHWSEQRFGRELMTPEVDVRRSPLSRLTLGAMEDLGYQVNWAAAEPYSLGG